MNTDQRYDVIIVGAGISGLTAALRCENAGYRTLLLESDSEVGGRVRSDKVDGFTLDRGFQVIIDSYEKAEELLDFQKLDLCRFAPGARIFDDKGSFKVADPLRRPADSISTSLSRVGSISDKWNILKLAKELQRKNLPDLFSDDGQSTMNYLRLKGFSDRMIENFFRPFFGGIFLERDLKTSSSMFRFVFRNFSLGHACLPAKGMGEIPLFIKSKLANTELRTNFKVKTIYHTPHVELEDGTRFACRKIILACNPEKLLPQLAHELRWNGTITQYFQSSKNAPAMKGMIGLDVRNSSPINNFARHDEISPELAPPDRGLWSVTLRTDSDPSDTAKALSQILKTKSGEFKFIRSYEIGHALPVVDRPKLSIPPEQTQITEHIHLAGDFLTNASIDGAMRAGEAAAVAVSETLEVRDNPGKSSVVD